jgi:hypothetical protein
VTSSGSAYGRFRRALDNSNFLAARAAAIELKHVGLAEALELTHLILAREPTQFRAAALRWHARYCGDNKATLEEAPPCSDCSPCSKVGERSQQPALLPAFSTAARSCRRLRCWCGGRPPPDAPAVSIQSEIEPR